MSELGGFLFGNLDETGKLDNEEWDEEIRQSLSLLTGKVSGMSIVGMTSLGITKVDIQSNPTAAGLVEETEVIPLDRGEQDYSIIDEVYEEETAVEFKPRNRVVEFTSLFSLSKIKKYALKRVRFRKKALNAKILMYAEDESEQFEKANVARRWRERFSMSISALVLSLQNQATGANKRKPSKVQASVSEALKAYAPSEVPQASRAIEPRMSAWELHPVNLTSWEEGVIFDEAHVKLQYPSKNQLTQLYSDARHAEANLPLSAPTTRPPNRNANNMPPPNNRNLPPAMGGRNMNLGGNITVSAIASGTVSASAAAAALAAQRRIGSQQTSPVTSPTTSSFNPIRNLATRIPNVDLEQGTWEEQVIWDETRVQTVLDAKLVLNMNDPSLIFEAVELDNRKLNRAEKLIAKRLKKLKDGANGVRLVIGNYGKPVADKYNLSNDKLYELKAPMVIRSGKHKQSANAIGRMSLQHSVPALKLLPPNFKTTWSKSELRQWHRPNINFAPGGTITFSPTKAIKRTTAMSGRLNQVIRKTKDLTLRDGSPAVLLEYTEREPMLLMNPGMATFIYLYYRKRDAKDEYVPEDEVGFGAVLDVNDPSPFWIYGDVAPGQQMYALSNNMFRASLGRQEAPRTDFLCLRYSHKGRVQYFMRTMPPVLSVGQVLPAVQVYNPHSRKLLNYARKRIQVAAYRLFQKDALGKRLRIGRILSAFPQFSEGSIRKWLKEYAESHRGGHEASGLWFMKADAPRLSEEDLRSLVTPEMACIYEAMLVGQQRLLDQGISIENDVMDEEKDGGLEEVEEEPMLRSAPWNLTNNALLAAEGRLMLQVTGAGEGKVNFMRDKRDENPGKGTRPRSGELLLQHKAKLAQAWRTMQSILNNSKSTSSVAEQEQMEEDVGSVYSASTNATGRKLVITRTMTDAEGNAVSTTETITDPRVISQYLRKQQELAVKRKRRANANKASQAPKRKKPRPANTGEGKVVKERKTVVKEQANVRCGACGAYGHMRTNRICPMFNSNNSSTGEAPVKVEGGKLTISMDSLKKVAEERSKTLLFKLPTRVLTTTTTTSGTSTPPSTESSYSEQQQQQKKMVVKKRKLAPWQRIMEELPQYKPDLEAFNRGISEIISALKAEPDSWPFHRPVNKRQYPLYYKIISKPVDLQTIGMAASKCKYTRSEEFLERVELMARNCVQYNGEEHAFSKCAGRLVQIARERCEGLKNLEEKLQSILLNTQNNNSEATTNQGENNEEEDEVIIEDEDNEVE